MLILIIGMLLSLPAYVTCLSPRKFRVLALHGKGGNGVSFEKRLAPLIALTSENFEWHFATAPNAVDGGPDSFAWWTMPPGVRSFEAKEFGGLDESLKVLDESWLSSGPFDVVFGHSQGAMLTAIVLARATMTPQSSFEPATSAVSGLSETSSSRPNGLPSTPVIFKPRCAVLTGAAWPNPFDALFNDLRASSSPPPATLHCWGTSDTMNPPAYAEKLKDCFGEKGQELVHSGGHVVPMDPSSMASIVRFLDEATTTPA
mmetsp:Transcript_58621/g.117740  ORF Transcript_58621/g.117740 Transcript_58621/m.117740 type:complete len:259 (+) Transcript_58621:88-864(+)